MEMKTRLTEILGLKYPVIQGGMAWVAESHLASAVSKAGGLGLIAAASAQTYQLSIWCEYYDDQSKCR